MTCVKAAPYRKQIKSTAFFFSSNLHPVSFYIFVKTFQTNSAELTDLWKRFAGDAQTCCQHTTVLNILVELNHSSVHVGINYVSNIRREKTLLANIISLLKISTKLFQNDIKCQCTIESTLSFGIISFKIKQIKLLPASCTTPHNN